MSDDAHEPVSWSCSGPAWRVPSAARRTRPPTRCRCGRGTPLRLQPPLAARYEYGEVGCGRGRRERSGAGPPLMVLAGGRVTGLARASWVGMASSVGVGVSRSAGMTASRSGPLALVPAENVAPQRSHRSRFPMLSPGICRHVVQRTQRTITSLVTRTCAAWGEAILATGPRHTLVAVLPSLWHRADLPASPAWRAQIYRGSWTGMAR